MAAAAELASNAAERGAELASNAAEKGNILQPLPSSAPYVSPTVLKGLAAVRATSSTGAVSFTCDALAGRAWWAKVKSTVGFEEMQEEEPAQTSLLTQINEATSLNRMQVSANRAARPLCITTPRTRSGASLLTAIRCLQRIYGFLISLALALFFGFCVSTNLSYPKASL